VLDHLLDTGPAAFCFEMAIEQLDRGVESWSMWPGPT
jgi:hypothetical protein